MPRLTPPEEPIVVRSGDRVSFRLLPPSPEVWDRLKGNTWLAQVRDKESSDTVAVTLETYEEADALIVTIPETTQNVWGDSSKTTWKGVFDVQGMADGTIPRTVMSGEFIIERDVSRA